MQSITQRFIRVRLVWITIGIITFISGWKYFSPKHFRTTNSSIIENNNNDSIPSIVHFVIGQGDKKHIRVRYPRSVNFSFVNYLIFLAARRQIRPKQIYVHYYYEPNTFWWNQTKQDSEINITLVKSRLVENIFTKPVDSHAHRGDIVRLEVVMKYGGIYLDIDVLALRSFDPLLNLSDVVMAHQENNENTACNAVIIGKKNAQFLKRLYDTYQSFNQIQWDYHSVRLPGQLAKIYSNEIKVLPTNTFFRPSYDEMKTFFESNDYNFSSNYASHLWNKRLSTGLNKLTPETILTGNFTLARMFRQAIGNDTLKKLKKSFTNF